MVKKYGKKGIPGVKYRDEKREKKGRNVVDKRRGLL